MGPYSNVAERTAAQVHEHAVSAAVHMDVHVGMSVNTEGTHDPTRTG